MLEKRIPIILDTDIGDDIDDAFALALVTSLPIFHVVGVTTVFRKTDLRAKMVRHFLSVVNRNDIPVHQGEIYPYLEPLKSLPNEIGTDGAPCYYDSNYDKYQINAQNAVDFIIEQAHAYAGELVIVPIGPLTNIARAIEKDPLIKTKINKIVMMSGWFTNYVPEWNVFADPEAADIVYSSGINIDCVGLDVTLQCTVEKDLLDQLFTSKHPDVQLLATWFKRWQEKTKFDKSVMHDPLAVATLISDVCQFEPKSVKVNLTDNRGATQVLDDVSKGSIVNVATQVDREKFYDIFKRYILQD